MTSVEPRSELIELEGGVVHLVRAGDGDPVLFLHAGPGVGPWNPFFAEVARNHELLIPEHPGYGRSDDFPELSTIDDLVQHYVRLLDRLGISSATVVGASFGGWIAAELASRHPSRIERLVLMAAVGIEVPGHPYVDVFALAPEDTRELIFHDPEVAASLPAPPPAQVQAAARHRVALERFARDPLLHDPRLIGRLGAVTASTNVLWPVSDRIVPRAIAEVYAERIPDATLHVLPDHGHALYAERPEQLGRLVDALLRTEARELA